MPVEEQKRLRKVIEVNKRELVSFAGPSGIPCRGEGVAQVVVHDDWIAAIEEREREDNRRRRRQARERAKTGARAA